MSFARHFFYRIRIYWVRIKQGIAFLLLSRDRYARVVRQKLYARIQSGRHREPEEQLISHFISNGATCVDIGAFYGEFTYLFSKQCGPKGRVLSIEPVQYNLEILKDLITHFKLENVTVKQTALGAEQGTAVMSFPKVLGVDQTAIARLVTNGTGESVPVATLDGLFEELQWNSLDFLKCDVEGAELLVLAGAERAIREYHPVLLIEIAEKWAARYGYHSEDVFSRIEVMGYHTFFMLDTLLIPFGREQRYTQQSFVSNHLISNYFFIPSAKITSYSSLIKV